MDKSLSDRGLEMLKGLEGVIYKIYSDPAHLPTGGVGHLLDRKERERWKIGDKVSEDQVKEWLRKDVEKASEAVNDWVVVELSQWEFDALVSFVFNVGVGAFKRSTLLKKINKGAKMRALEEFQKWSLAGGKKLPGLVNRRNKERDLFLNGYG